MKSKLQIALISTLAYLLINTLSYGQSPEAMSYQAVIRDADDNLVTGQTVGMQISILQGSASGTEVYVETQTPTTNANGLVSIEIGTGTTSDDFSDIDWSDGPYYLKTEIDPTGGTSYTITGTSQLLSVPYALYAKTAESLTEDIEETDPVYSSSIASSITATDTANWNNKLDSYTETDPEYTSSVASGITTTDTANWNNKLDEPSHYVGELYGGGVVFWVDHTGESGLIVSMADLSTSQAWSNVTNKKIGTTNDWDGASNTDSIIGQSNHASSAAQLCVDYINPDYGTGTYRDWYLPSLAELNHVWINFYEVQKALTNDGNSTTTPLTRDNYWSSSEYLNYYAWYFNFHCGYAGTYTKNASYYVRAVRAF